jgi:MFS transporter, ACS family, solute carrier family 17 (sodium-dependent inorganic phosphate cotransporter), other
MSRLSIENFFKLFGIGVGVTAVLTLFTPLAANWSLYALIAVRIVEGLFEVKFEWFYSNEFTLIQFNLNTLQGVTYSSLYEMWSKWAPPFERSRMVVAAFTGNYVGIVISLPISGILAETW